MNAKMIVCALPYSGDDVLLVKYRDMPDHQSGWFVPHVMLNEKEHPEDAAKRTLADQFAITNARLKFSHFESFTGRDGSWHLIFHFKSKESGREIPKQSSDLAAVEWFANEAAANERHFPSRMGSGHRRAMLREKRMILSR